jgi:hypothetical protein
LRAAVLPIGAVIALSGCWDLLPASRDATRDAEHREPEVCGPSRPSYPEGLFSPDSVVSVSPLYFTKSVRGDQEQELLGVTLVIRPFPAVSSQELERMLNCHAARSQLRKVGEPTVANDPYWVPGHVVRISVDFDEGVTKVKVEGRDFTTAKEILARARAFVRETATTD